MPNRDSIDPSVTPVWKLLVTAKDAPHPSNAVIPFYVAPMTTKKWPHEAETFGTLIRSIRETNGYTRGYLARNDGPSESTQERVEQAETIPSSRVILDYAKALERSGFRIHSSLSNLTCMYHPTWEAIAAYLNAAADGYSNTAKNWVGNAAPVVNGTRFVLGEQLGSGNTATVQGRVDIVGATEDAMKHLLQGFDVVITLGNSARMPGIDPTATYGAAPAGAESLPPLWIDPFTAVSEQGIGPLLRAVGAPIADDRLYVEASRLSRLGSAVSDLLLPHSTQLKRVRDFIDDDAEPRTVSLSSDLWAILTEFQSAYREILALIDKSGVAVASVRSGAIHLSDGDQLQGLVIATDSRVLASGLSAAAVDGGLSVVTVTEQFGGITLLPGVFSKQRLLAGTDQVLVTANPNFGMLGSLSSGTWQAVR